MSATSLRSVPGAWPDGLNTDGLNTDGLNTDGLNTDGLNTDGVNRGRVVAAARRIRAYTIVGRSAGVTHAGERLAGCSAEFAEE